MIAKVNNIIKLLLLILFLLSIVGEISAESVETPQYKYVYPLVYLKSYWRYDAYHSVVYVIAIENTTVWIDTNFNGPDSSDKIYHLSKGESLRIGKAGGDFKRLKLSTYFFEWEKNPLIIYSDKPIITYMVYFNGNHGVYDDVSLGYATPEPGTKLLGTNVTWLYITPYSEDTEVYINGKYEGVVKYGTVLIKKYSSPQTVVITSDKPVVAVSVYVNKDNLDKTYAFPLQPPKSGKFLIPNSVEKYAKERKAIDVNEYYVIMDSNGKIVNKSKLPEEPMVISLEDSAVFVFRSFYYKDPWTGDYRYTMTAQTVKPVQEATLFGSIGPENMHDTIRNVVFYAEGEVKIYKDYNGDSTIDSVETLPGGEIYKFSDRETNPDTPMRIYVVGNISGSFLIIGGWVYHIEGGHEIGISPYSFQPWDVAIFAETIKINDATGSPGDIISVPVKIFNTTTNIMGINLWIDYNSSVINLINVTRAGLTADWEYAKVGQVENKTKILLATAYDEKAIPSNSSGLICYLNFKVVGNPGDKTIIRLTNAELSDPYGNVGKVENLINGIFEIPEYAMICGYVIYSNNGTPIEGVYVLLDGNMTVTDANGYFEFKVMPGNYTLIFVKPHFYNETINVSVSAGEIKEVNITMRLRGDLNNNGRQADIGDVVLMLKANVGKISPDRYYDLNNNGRQADIGDVVLILKANVGKIIL